MPSIILRVYKTLCFIKTLLSILDSSYSYFIELIAYVDTFLSFPSFCIKPYISCINIFHIHIFCIKPYISFVILTVF